MGVLHRHVYPSVTLPSASPGHIGVTGSQHAKLAQVHVDLLHDMVNKYASHSDLHGGVPLYVQQSALCDAIAIGSSKVLMGFSCESGRHVDLSWKGHKMTFA